MRISDYPFTEAAAKEVREAGYSLESLLGKTIFRGVRSRAAQRVSDAMSGTITETATNTQAEQLAELLSYPLARIMVSCLDDSILLRRYALAEAKLAFRMMQKEKEGLDAIANDLGLHPQGPGPYKIHFSEYIRAAHRMHSPKWKLTNRDLMQGYLTITREELMRIMEEAAREKIMKGLPIPADEETCASLQEYLQPLKEQLERIRARDRVDLGAVNEGAFPPCIKSMLKSVAKGNNLAHSARFALVSFLLQINMTAEEVISLFSTSPDYDEERTRYQVEHIAGASGTSYKPPACATMATYGNCPGEDELCRKIRHPLSYYERRMRIFKPLSPERQP
ncbi:MAG: DNA primase large subunit PriL [Methanosaeta sp. PtaU1.Bin112]|nr:MAG: DNA primase large subunit PriL [Methanosaeta sp. PtaU1.Bin112]